VSKSTLFFRRAFSEIAAFYSHTVRASTLRVSSPPPVQGVVPVAHLPSLMPLWQNEEGRAYICQKAMISNTSRDEPNYHRERPEPYLVVMDTQLKLTAITI
jgi:hypothetical protein